MSKKVTTEKVPGQPFRYNTTARQHTWVADAASPPAGKGSDTGANPVEHMLGALAECIAMTVEAAASNRKYNVTKIKVTISLDETDDPDEAGKKVPLFDEKIELEGDLDDVQLGKLKLAAQACTVYKLMTGKKQFRNDFVVTKPVAAPVSAPEPVVEPSNGC